MKIIFVLDSLGTGGAERSSAELWYYLREQGVIIKIIVLEHRQVGIEQEILAAGFDVTFLRGKNGLGHASQLVKVIRTEKPDLVHSVLFRASLRVRMARMVTRFVLVEHLVNCTYAKARLADPKVNKWALLLYKQIDRVTSKAVDWFIAITHEVKAHYHTQLGYPPEKMVVIYRGRKPNPGINNKAELNAQFRSELGIAKDVVVFLHAGRQEYQKGHLILLKAIVEIEKKMDNPSSVYLLCGREGNATQEIQEQLKTHPLSNVKWLGHRYDLNKLMLCADVFVFPSLFEGLGGVLIEAQSAGLPIICSDLPVFNEVVTSRNALRFKSGDSIDLANQIEKISHDSGMRTAMGQASLANYESSFMLDAINESVLKYFSALTSSKQ